MIDPPMSLPEQISLLASNNPLAILLLIIIGGPLLGLAYMAWSRRY